MDYIPHKVTVAAVPRRQNRGPSRWVFPGSPNGTLNSNGGFIQVPTLLLFSFFFTGEIVLLCAHVTQRKRRKYKREGFFLSRNETYFY